ncbi:MAG: SGNH/GDSL hydrolase family protein [Nitrospinae bacterium]|nr:SGNH/GDSL hydrolase family protein [Nitrospinota bacterium]
MGRSYCPGTKGHLKENQVKMHVEVNADGLLGKPYPIERVPGKFRIALLGDSFTSAEAVKPEEKFAGVWEKNLSNRSAGGIEVINFGVGGTGTWQQLQMFHIKARKYQPDLTVVAFCWCNDIDNNIDKFKSGSMSPLLDEYDVGVFKVLQAKRKNFNKWLWNNSGLYQFTRTKYNHLEHYFKRMFLPDYMKKVPASGKKEEPDANRKKADEKKQKPPEYLKDTVSIFDDLFFFESEGWEITRKLLLKLKQEVQSNGSELAVIHFGGVHQYRNFPALPIQKFDTFLESQGIAHFNAFDLFKNIDDEFLHENFIPDDGHFSKTGHRHFAEYSTDFLLNLIQKK